MDLILSDCARSCQVSEKILEQPGSIERLVQN